MKTATGGISSTCLGVVPSDTCGEGAKTSLELNVANPTAYLSLWNGHHVLPSPGRGQAQGELHLLNLPAQGQSHCQGICATLVGEVSLGHHHPWSWQLPGAQITWMGTKARLTEPPGSSSLFRGW